MSDQSATHRVLWDDDTSESVSTPYEGAHQTYDVAVIGGGFTGLSTTLSLARRGAKTVLFEAGSLAGKASGRNGGQVVPGLKPAPKDLIARYGTGNTTRMMHFANSAADYVFALIDELGIDCSPTRNGWIQCAISTRARDRLYERVRALDHWHADVAALTAEEMAAALGTDCYVGGYIEAGAGAVHPRKFALGLAQASAQASATLHANTPVLSLERTSSGWKLGLAQGQVHARGVVLATDAYTGGLLPDVSRSMVHVASAQTATEPLPAALLREILPRRAGISDARKLTVYCRISPDGRFLIGGRSDRGDLVNAAAARRLRSAACLRFPALRDVRWSSIWAGRIALTLDDVPHLHNPAPELWTACGYGGRGVALAVRFGSTLADALTGVHPAELDYPVTPVRALPWHWLHRPAVSAAIHWHRLRDAVGFPA